MCCELPIHDDDDDKWVSSSSNSDNVFTSGEHKHGEDEEHFDAHELIDMVYETSEPSILLTCKEIRQECLPIYYLGKSFSWRFSWTDCLRSGLRFKYWARATSPHHLGLVAGITFQGRHMVEEGLEFSIDVDLLSEHLFFETRSYAEADADADIAAAIHQDMASNLWLMVQSTRRRPILSAGLLCELANIFVQGMHRDAGGCLMSDEALACRRVLSPLF